MATNVATIPTQARTVAIDFNDPVSVYLDADIFNQLQRVAKLMSSANVVPQHLRGDTKLSDCFLVAAQAFRWRMDPFSVAQHTFVVSGKLGYEGKLIAGIINASGKLKHSLRYDYAGEGDQRRVTVSGTLTGEDSARTVEGRLSDWRTTNEQWKKNPDQMLSYRGAREWARRHMPEAALGIHAEDDLAPATSVQMRDVTPAAAIEALLTAPEPAHDGGDDVTARTPEDVTPTSTGSPAAPDFLAEIAAAQSITDLAAIDARIRAATIDSTTKRNLSLTIAKRRAEMEPQK